MQATVLHFPIEVADQGVDQLLPVCECRPIRRPPKPSSNTINNGHGGTPVRSDGHAPTFTLDGDGTESNRFL